MSAVTRPRVVYRGNPVFYQGAVWNKPNEALALAVYGPEATVAAMFHRLVMKHLRGEPFKSEVEIHDGAGEVKPIAISHGRHLFRPKPVTSPHGRWVSGILLTEGLLPSKEPEFLFLKDENQPEEWFFKRLSNVSTIPLRVEWAGWLWQRALSPITVRYINNMGVGADKKPVPPSLATEAVSLVSRVNGDGLEVYRVKTDGILGEYRLGWLEIIWRELGLKEQMFSTSTGYSNSTLEIAHPESEFLLTEKKTGKVLVKSEQLDFLVAKARMAGVPLVLS